MTSLELAIVGLVHIEPTTGYDLCKLFESTPMGRFSSSPGAVYPALRRLEKRGVIAGRVQYASSLRPRKVYSTTRDGKRLLKERIAAPVTDDDLVWDTEDLLLRFSFMGHVVGLSDTRRFLEELAAKADARVKGLESHLRSMKQAGTPADVLPTGRLALAYGTESYRGLARWARKALKELGHSRTSGES